MPEPITLLAFALAALALIAIPGPNMLYIATRSLAQGSRAGVASALGVGVGTLVHILAAAVGLSALIASSAVAFNVVKYLGAAYLIYLGIRAFRSREELERAPSGDRAPLRRAFAEGILVNVLNPKVALFFLAFLPQFVDPSRGVTAQILVLGAVFFAIALCMDMLYAFGAGAVSRALRRRSAPVRARRYITGSVYVALGATAALTGGHRQRG